MTVGYLALSLLTLAVPPPPATPAPPGEVWRAHMARVHETARVHGSFLLRAVADKPARGYSAVPPAAPRPEGMGPPAAVLYVAKKPLLAITRLRGAYVRWPGLSGYEGGGGEVFLEWFPDGRRQIHAVTKAAIGKRVALFLNGKFQGAPKVLEAIDQDEIQVMNTRERSVDEVARLLRALNPAVDTAFVEGFRRRCAEGDAPTCRVLGEESLRGRDLPFAPEAAFDYLVQACEAGDLEACARAADLAADFPLHGKRGEEIRLWEKACSGKHLPACSRLGRALSYQSSTVLRKRAEVYYGQACDGGDGAACMDLIRLLEDREGRAAMEAIKARLAQACGFREVTACLYLGELALQEKPSDPDAAKTWFQKACAHDPQARLDFTAGDATPADRARATLMRAAGCDVPADEPTAPH